MFEGVFFPTELIFLRASLYIDLAVEGEGGGCSAGYLEPGLFFFCVSCKIGTRFILYSVHTPSSILLKCMYVPVSLLELFSK